MSSSPGFRGKRFFSRRSGALAKARMFVLVASSILAVQAATAQHRGSVDALLSNVNTNGGESWLSISRDGRLALFGRHDSGWSRHTVWQTAFVDGAWTEPEVVSFSGSYNDRGARFAPGDGSVVFSSDRPRTDDSDSGNFNLWSVAYDGASWSPPRLLTGVNSASSDWHASATRHGVLYFASRRPEGRGNSDLYRAVPEARGYAISLLPEHISSRFSEADVFADPEDRFIIFARTDAPEGNGGDDLYLSFHDGSVWSHPEHLGDEVNSSEYEYGAWVDGCSARLLYTTHRDGQADIRSIGLDELVLSRPLPVECPE